MTARSETPELAPPAGRRDVASRLRAVRASLPRLLPVLGILLVAAFLRLDGLHWDANRRLDADGKEVLEEQHLHPDERFLTMVTSALEVPRSFAEYLDTGSSPFNPHNKNFGFFVYGTLPIFVTKLVAAAIDKSSYWDVHIVGRVLAASFSLLSVLLLFVLGRRLYGRTVGLVAALLLGLSALPIQQAHFYTVDAFADTFVVLGLLCAWSVQTGGRTRAYAGFGLALGAAMACKLNLVLLAAVVVAAAAAGPGLAARRRGEPAHRWLLGPLLRLSLAAVLAFLVFRLLQPYAFTGPGLFDLRLNPAWWANMQEVRELMSGARDVPPGHQWAGRTPIWFPWKNIVLWGLGTPLGLAAWAGWAWAGYQMLRAKRWVHLVPWVWVTVLFGQQGLQWVKSFRYFLPIYPALTLFAAVLVVEGGRRLWPREAAAGTPPSRARRFAAVALAVVVIGGAAAWAWAFTSIYRRPHSRIAASHWIYRNVPPGAGITFEVWDDPLPLRIEGLDGGNIYRGIELNNYAEDTPEKLGETLSKLAVADVLVLSSNRLYDSIPRLPMRFPMMVRFYRYLFSGELGFRKVAEFSSYPRLLGWEFPDQKAEEAWSVYDHPRVQIFVRTPEWSVERARELLEPESWDDVERLSPLEARSYRTLTMDPGLQRAQRAGGTWLDAAAAPGRYRLEGFAARHPVVAWAVTLELLGLIAFPLCFALFPRFADRGYLLSKTVGLLGAAFLSWALGSLRWVPYGRGGVAVAAALLALASAALLWPRRGAMLAFVRSHLGALAGREAVFWLFFVALLLCRYHNPDLWHAARGGEKPMDFAYLNAIARSTFFPPYDPWFAGGYINYYYFGFVVAATPMVLTKVAPAIAYNLIVPTLFALTAAGAFVAASELAAALGAGGKRPRLAAARALWGTAGAVFVVALGNLTEIALLVRGLRRLGGGNGEAMAPLLQMAGETVRGLRQWLRPDGAWPLPNDWWFWNASRAIPHPPNEPPAITEFPFFTFLFADLHAHMMAMPITLLVLAIAVHLVVSGRRGPSEPESEAGRLRWPAEAALLAVLAIAVGALWPTNTWDYPLGVLLAALGLLLRETGRAGWQVPAAWWRAAWRVAAVLVSSRIAFFWFHRSFATTYSKLSLWHGGRTPLLAYLGVHGLFLLVLLVYVGRELALARRLRAGGRLALLALRRRPGRGGWWRHRRLWCRRGDGLVVAAMIAAATTMALLVAAGHPLEGFLGAAIVLAAALALYAARDPVEALVAVMVLIGLGLSLLVEHVVLSGDIGRMNTVFKFYLQVWLLWGTASAAALARMVSGRRPERSPARPRTNVGRAVAVAARSAFAVGVAVAIAVALLYTVFATGARLRDRFDTTLGPGLDGSSFLETATHFDKGPLELRWDADAFRWLERNVIGTPVVLEAAIPPYRWGSRVSMFTGLPTVLGWDWHQRQQRSVRRSDPVGRRLRDIETIYSYPDATAVVPLLRRYQVELVYVGQVERGYYSEEGLRKFATAPELFAPVYASEQVQIYRVLDATPAGAPPLLREPELSPAPGRPG